MSRRPARCTQADMRRAIDALVQSGARDMAVEVSPDGTIRFTPIRPQPANDADLGPMRESVL